jgi:hypothetical protein
LVDEMKKRRYIRPGFKHMQARNGPKGQPSGVLEQATNHSTKQETT